MCLLANLLCFHVSSASPETLAATHACLPAVLLDHGSQQDIEAYHYTVSGNPPPPPASCVCCAEETNARVAWFSIFSLAVCVASAVFQLMYLRKFFQRKKLL